MPNDGHDPYTGEYNGVPRRCDEADSSGFCAKCHWPSDETNEAVTAWLEHMRQRIERNGRITEYATGWHPQK